MKDLDRVGTARCAGRLQSMANADGAARRPYPHTFRDSILTIVGCAFSLVACHPGSLAGADPGQLRFVPNGTGQGINVLGDAKDEWRFQVSTDLVTWTNAPALGSVFGSENDNPGRSIGLEIRPSEHGFVRGIKTTGLFDVNLLRTFNFTFTNANFVTL